MAEYRMTYLDAKKFIDECADKSSTPELIKSHSPEILAALTAKTSVDYGMNEKSLDETVTLWRNQIGNPSELLLGTKYFSIKSSMIELVEGMAGSGILDLIVSNCVAGAPLVFQGITVGTIANLAITLEHIFKVASDLEDHDFCVYMQATTHFREYREFTQDDLLRWFPNEPDNICNMHNSTWDCEYYINDDKCDMLKNGHLDCALASLKGKEILSLKRKNGKDYYSFVW